MPCQINSTDQFFAPTRSFFTNPENHLARFLKTHDGQDKILKLAGDILLPVTMEIADSANASDGTLKGLKTTGDVIKVARDVTGFFNIFRGKIAQTYLSLRDFFNVLSSLGSADPAHLKEGNRKYNDEAHGTSEKVLKSFSTGFRAGQGLAYIAGFGVIKPMANGRKYFGFNYGSTGNDIAGSFSNIMLGLHASGAAHHSFELGFQLKAFQRVSRTAGYNVADEDTFKQAIKKNAMGLIEQILELTDDGFGLINNSTQVPVPVWLRLPIRTTLCGLGLVKAWQETPKPKNA